MSITTQGDSIIKDGSLTLRNIASQDNTYSVLQANSMTTTERGLFTFTGPTIIYDSTLSQWFLNASAGVFQEITTLPSIAESRLVGRSAGVGSGVPQVITPTDQFTFDTSGNFGLVEQLNKFGLAPMSAKLVYELGNNSVSETTISSAITSLHAYSIPANTLFYNNDNLSGMFGGTWINALPNDVKISLFVNNILVFSNTATLSPSGSFKLEFNIMRYASNGLRCCTSGSNDNDTGGGSIISDVNFINIAFDPTAIFKIDLMATASDASSSATCSISTLKGASFI